MAGYYTVPIDETLLEQYGYAKCQNGRWEKTASPFDRSFEHPDSCPRCGGRIHGYRKIVCSNGALQIRIVCANGCGCCNAVQRPSAKQWGKRIRGEVWN